MKYLVYSDGSCSARDRVGGYAWKIVDEYEEVVGGGSEVDTTISRMELMAAISALEAIRDHEVLMQEHFPLNDPERSVVLVLSDSEHVVLGFNIKTRARNKNVDLWDRLENVAEHFELVYFEHVKGHAGHQDNEDCDKLAGEFRKAALEGLKNAEG